MKVICIDDSYKPNSISNSHWIKKGETYTVVKISQNMLSREMFFILEEVEPDDKTFGGYKVNRFSFTEEEILEFEAQVGIEYTNPLSNY